MSSHDLIAHLFWIIVYCLDILQFIHSPSEGYLVSFQVWTIMNKASIMGFPGGSDGRTMDWGNGQSTGIQTKK